MQHDRVIIVTIVKWHKVMTHNHAAFHAIYLHRNVLVINHLLEAALILNTPFVMVAANQMDMSMQLVCIIFHRGSVPIGKVSQNIDVVLRPDFAVPAFDECLIHLIDRIPWPCIKLETVCVPKVQVCNK